MLKTIKKRWEIAKCAIRVNNSIDKNNILCSRVNEYKNLLDFIERFEILRFYYARTLNLQEPNQQIALFALVYYFLDFQDDDYYFYFGEDKEKLTATERNLWIEVTNFIKSPKEDYKIYILNYLSKKYSINNANETFKKHLNHLYKINFYNFITSDCFEKYTHIYLFSYFYTKEFEEIDLEKNLIMVDENHGTINFEELNNQFHKIDVRYSITKHDFYQSKTLSIKNLIDVSLKKSLNSEILMLRKKFAHFD